MDARAYLARAKQQLLQNTSEALFYAAFELRCCVEARQEEYATGIEYITAKIKPWKIGETAKRLERVFESNKIARVTLAGGDSGPFVLYHTPVTQRLYDNAQKLGDLLHCMKRFKADDDPFWSRTRAHLTGVYRDAWYSCQGQLITPPLWNSKTKKTHPFKIEEASEQLKALLEHARNENFTVSIKIEYMDQPPREWVCDLPLNNKNQ